MFSISQQVYSYISQAVFGSSSAMAANSTNSIPYSADRYRPSPQDVLAVKQNLLSLRLPLELIDTIIDHGEYWPHVKVVREGTALTVRNDDNRFVVSLYPSSPHPDAS